MPDEPISPATQPAQLLRHTVLFGFSPESSDPEVDEIVRRFTSLSEQIAGIERFEWGVNESPEDLNNDLTHCFVLTFASTEARDSYLIDPAHVAFADWVGTWVRHVTVVDYWATRSS